MCAGVEAWWRRIRHQEASTAASAPLHVGGKGVWGYQTSQGVAEKTGVCVQGWGGWRLGIWRIRHQVAPKAAPEPQHGPLCRSLPGWRLGDSTERVGGDRVKGHLESAEAGGECVRASVLEPPRVGGLVAGEAGTRGGAEAAGA
eukprot:3934750-Rhodomonas_salina.1